MLSLLTLEDYSTGLDRYIPSEGSTCLVNVENVLNVTNESTSPKAKFYLNVNRFDRQQRSYWAIMTDVDAFEADTDTSPSNNLVPFNVYTLDDNGDLSDNTTIAAEHIANISLIVPFGTDKSKVFVQHGGNKLKEYIVMYTPTQIYAVITGTNFYTFGSTYVLGTVGDNWV